MDQDLLSQNQRTAFVEMINDAIRQVKADPSKVPITGTYRRNTEKVLFYGSYEIKIFNLFEILFSLINGDLMINSVIS